MATRSRAAANEAAISDAVELARSSVFYDDPVEGLPAEDMDPAMHTNGVRWQTISASTNGGLNGDRPTTSSCII